MKDKIFLLVLFFILLQSCAPSSYSERYSDDKDVDEINRRAGRFSSGKEKTEKSINPVLRPVQINADTLKVEISDSCTTDEDYVDSEFEEDFEVDRSLLMKNPAFSYSPDSLSASEKVIMEIIAYLDTPYKYGGNSDSGIDCSAFTMSIYQNIFELKLPRSSREQFAIGKEIEELDELKFGDLIFFKTRLRSRSNPGHVGIYIGEGLFAHASRKKGVIISSVDETYYAKRFVGGRRVEEVENILSINK